MKLPNLRKMIFDDDLRPAILFTVNLLLWAIVIGLAEKQGIVVLGAVAAALNLSAAVFRFLLFLKTGNECRRRDIQH
tara:strand:+ start:367 stop:597 length:231 start_codon:yes stop_codon:yes gene_type:complete